jgi:hypothetical protein
MRIYRTFALLAAILLFGLMLTDPLISQDKPPAKPVFIPTLYRDLKLTDEQQKKMLAVRGEFQPKIDAIEKEIRTLKSHEKADMEAVLTDEQKKLYRTILLRKAGVLDDKKDEKK